MCAFLPTQATEAPKKQAKALSERIEMGFWENIDADHTVMRIATSWATRPEDVDALIDVI